MVTTVVKVGQFLSKKKKKKKVGQSIQRILKSFNQLKCHRLAPVIGKTNNVNPIHIGSGLNHFFSFSTALLHIQGIA